MYRGGCRCVNGYFALLYGVLHCEDEGYGDGHEDMPGEGADIAVQAGWTSHGNCVARAQVRWAEQLRKGPVHICDSQRDVRALP